MLKRYQWLIHLGIITVFIWVIVGIVMSITGYVLYELPKPAKQPEISVETQRKRLKEKAYYDLIKTRDLFKVELRGPVSGVGPKEDTVRPIAEMGISLKGTISGPVEIARAIIEEKGKQQLYRVGDEIMGAKVLAIFRNKVIMDVNGLEQMLVPEEPGAKKGKVAYSTSARGTPSAVPPGLSGGAAGMTTVMQNMEQFLGNARVVPYYKGGEPYGFRLSNVEDDSPVFAFGARSGDIIRSVNGIRVRTPEEAFMAYQGLQNQSSVQVELERSGSSLTVNLPLK
jgi:general secretion pathway protein C